MSFSILILTLNEEACLPACLSSVGWCDDVVVLDSGSVDATVEIAAQAGARCFTRPFDNFAAQRNWGLDNIPFKHDWVFHLDADERMTGELRRECEAAVASGRAEAFAVASRTILMGRWIRHATAYPVFQTRLARRNGMRFIQRGHGQREPDDLTPACLSNALTHHTFAKGWSDWVERHNRYSTAEAEEELASEAVQETGQGTLHRTDPLARRVRLKRFARDLPLRPVIKFLYLYLLRLGILDGTPGLTYCTLQAIYEYFIVIKKRELRLRRDGLEL